MRRGRDSNPRYPKVRCISSAVNQAIDMTLVSHHQPYYHIPDYYLGKKILPNGICPEIFNGLGIIARELVQNRKQTKTNLHSISTKSLMKQNEIIQDVDRIPKRSNMCRCCTALAHIKLDPNIGL